MCGAETKRCVEHDDDTSRMNESRRSSFRHSECEAPSPLFLCRCPRDRVSSPPSSWPGRHRLANRRRYDDVVDRPEVTAGCIAIRGTTVRPPDGHTERPVASSNVPSGSAFFDGHPQANQVDMRDFEHPKTTDGLPSVDCAEAIELDVLEAGRALLSNHD